MEGTIPPACVLEEYRTPPQNAPKTKVIRPGPQLSERKINPTRLNFNLDPTWQQARVYLDQSEVHIAHLSLPHHLSRHPRLYLSIYLPYLLSLYQTNICQSIHLPLSFYIHLATSPFFYNSFIHLRGEWEKIGVWMLEREKTHCCESKGNGVKRRIERYQREH